MNQVDERKRPEIMRIGIIVLTVFTAAYHLYLSISIFGLLSIGATPKGATPEGLWMFAILFLLNCIGYLVLVYALYQPRFHRFHRFHRFTRWLFIGYTALTVLLWYLIASRVANLPDYSDKAAEALLIVLLLIEGRRTQRSSSLVAFP